MDLSVIVPTRNRANRVGSLLASVAVVEPPPFDWEVLILDNGSTDGTRAVVESFRSQISAPVRYILTERPGLHVGRNTGAREAKGECLAYLDDDTVVSSTWWRGVNPLLEHRFAAVAGRILPKWESPPPEWLNAYYQNGVCGPLTLLDLGREEVPVSAEYVWGANFFVLRDLVIKFGGFHPDGMPIELSRFRGDGETGFFKSFESAGLHACYSPEAVVQHVIDTDRLTVEYLCRRQFSQGVSDSYTQIRRNGMISKSPKVSWGVRLKSVARVINLATTRRRTVAVEDFVESDLSATSIDLRVKAAYKEGFEFHQREVRKDSALLEWVLRKDYW